MTGAEVVIGWNTEGEAVTAISMVDVLYERIQGTRQRLIELPEFLLTKREYEVLLSDLLEYNDEGRRTAEEAMFHGESFTLWGIPVRVIEPSAPKQASPSPA